MDIKTNKTKTTLINFSFLVFWLMIGSNSLEFQPQVFCIFFSPKFIFVINDVHVHRCIRLEKSLCEQLGACPKLFILLCFVLFSSSSVGYGLEFKTRNNHLVEIVCRWIATLRSRARALPKLTGSHRFFSRVVVRLRRAQRLWSHCAHAHLCSFGFENLDRFYYNFIIIFRVLWK